MASVPAGLKNEDFFKFLGEANGAMGRGQVGERDNM